MSMKAILVTAVGVLTVTPAFALTNSQIVHHTSGPIPYSQLSSTDRTGYNVRSHNKHTTATASAAAAADAPAIPAPAATTESSAAAPAAAPAVGASTSLPPATTTTPSNSAVTTPPSGAPQ
jgi:hypothetical protein